MDPIARGSGRSTRPRSSDFRGAADTLPAEACVAASRNSPAIATAGVASEREGWCWFFGAIDHHLDEVVGWHTAKLGDRWAALEPIRQGVHHAFGRFAKDVARGLALRCDWGPQYIADAWINEVKWLGCTISPSYVGEPECNGVAERFMRTLKEQCIYLYQFRSLQEAQRIIAEFITRYNTEWLIERLGHRTPAQARADAQRRAA